MLLKHLINDNMFSLDVKSSVPCRLAFTDSSGPIIVAEGTVHLQKETLSHPTPVKVSVDDLFLDYANARVPLPTPYVMILSQAKDSFIGWSNGIFSLDIQVTYV